MTNNEHKAAPTVAGLTDERIDALMAGCFQKTRPTAAFRAFARAVERTVLTQHGGAPECDKSYLEDASHPKDMAQAMEWITGLRDRVDNLLDVINAPAATPSTAAVRAAALEEATQICKEAGAWRLAIDIGALINTPAVAVRAAEEVERDAARLRWTMASHRWSMRWRLKAGKEQWQMVNDGESWGQWGAYRAVLDAAMKAYPGAPAADGGNGGE